MCRKNLIEELPDFKKITPSDSILIFNEIDLDWNTIQPDLLNHPLNL
jgi:hypothetical protein